MYFCGYQQLYRLGAAIKTALFWVNNFKHGHLTSLTTWSMLSSIFLLIQFFPCTFPFICIINDPGWCRLCPTTYYVSFSKETFLHFPFHSCDASSLRISQKKYIEYFISSWSIFNIFHSCILYCIPYNSNLYWC